MLRKAWLPLVAAGIALGTTQTAWAHPGHAGHEFVDGWMHPLVGLDHLLAMVAVGLLAARMGGRALWLMPTTFLASMLAGGVLASLGVPLPGVEYLIMTSVLVLGLLIAATNVIPLAVGAALVALFAAFHGHAHAAEMVDGGAFGPYAAGFLLATALLHVIGIAGGVALARWIDVRALRLTGGAITAASALLILGVL